MTTTRAAMLPWFLALTAALTVMLHASRVSTISMGFCATLLLIGYIQFFIWDNWRDGIFTSHWMYMTLLLRAGTQALRGDGYPVTVSPLLGLLATSLLVFIATHETVVTHLGAFHNYVHLTLYLCGALLALSACSEHLVTSSCCSCLTMMSGGNAIAARIRNIRVLTDPALLFAMGLLLIGHQHDPNPLSVALHSTFGYFLMALALCCFLCSLMHASLPHSSAACELMRSLHSFAWILTGGVTYTMCVAKYYTPSGGLKSYLDERHIIAKTGFEEATTYIAATVLGSSFHLALLHCSSSMLREKGQEEHDRSSSSGSAKGHPMTRASDEAVGGGDVEASETNMLIP